MARRPAATGIQHSRAGDDPTIARRHARLHPTLEGIYLVEDLGSRNGTFINGAPVQGWAALKPGDELQVGNRRLRLTIRP
ncbi:FHA domain-containing protein [Streptomyces sp. N2A]|uniref:FHA domain-containing protein n=1 Tax=Streptomyces sp. N2A TaxID=3073936 RepID=UPI0037D9EC4A